MLEVLCNLILKWEMTLPLLMNVALHSKTTFPLEIREFERRAPCHENNGKFASMRMKSLDYIPCTWT